jgi:hypothetical protein
MERTERQRQRGTLAAQLTHWRTRCLPTKNRRASTRQREERR